MAGPARVAEEHDATDVGRASRSLTSATGGLLAIGVPTELGGRGATISDLAAVQRELAKYCGSTALAASMHQHVVAFTAWRYRRGLPGAEATLRRIHDDGSCWCRPVEPISPGRGATPFGPTAGYLVTGRKMFVSQSPAGT